MSISPDTAARLTAMAKRMRLNALRLAYGAGKNGAHLGGGLSAVEVLAALYGYCMRLPKGSPEDPERDRFLLSKGHGTLAYYPALYEAGLISREQLFTFENNGGDLPGQPARNLSLGIESSSGSLGMGLSIGVGQALAAKMQGRKSRVYVLLGDGECNEGSVWEAAMSAVSFQLTNLVAIVDENGLQSDGPCGRVCKTAPLAAMWAGFGWRVAEVDGHDVTALCEAMDACREQDAPCVILARTVKGKGVSFMEGDRAWHHGILTEEQFQQAMDEVEHA